MGKSLTEMSLEELWQLFRYFLLTTKKSGAHGLSKSFYKEDFIKITKEEFKK